MTIENGVRAMAGTMVLASLALGLLVNTYWFFLTGFVGANLLQSAFTGICPAANLLAKLGLKHGNGCAK